MPDRTNCPYCSSPILPFVQFCPNCGRRLPTQAQQEEYSKDLYHILQVDPAADPEVIEAAYRRLAAKYHPDINSSPDAKSRMQEINAAHQILSNPDKRRDYDDLRRAANAAGAPTERRAAAPENGPVAAETNAEDDAVAQHQEYWANRRQREAAEANRAEAISASNRPTFTWVWIGIALVIACAVVASVLSQNGTGTSGANRSPTSPSSSSSARLPRFEPDQNTTMNILNSGQAVSLLDLTTTPTEPLLQSPGTQKFSVMLPNEKPVFLSTEWCAKDRNTLQDNMAHFRYSIVVNGYTIPSSQLHSLQSDAGKGEDPDFPDGLACNFYGILASQWPAGTHRVIQKWSFDSQVDDGYSKYDAGEYVMDFDVTVPSGSSSRPTDVPTLLPTKSPFSNCYSWDRVRGLAAGSDVCVYGNIHFQRVVTASDYSSSWTLIRFSEDTSTFYITSNYQFEAKTGDCVKAIGVLQYDSNGVPFLKTDELYKCN